MADAKVRNLTVKPTQVSHLCFDVDGIIESVNTRLGATANGFKFGNFYAGLGLTVPGSPSQLLYGSQGIENDAAVQASTIVTLRAEVRKAALDKAIAARQNAYFAKYQNSAAIIALMRKYYGAAANAKPAMLAALSTLSQNQASLLHAAYAADGRLSVVKSSTSESESKTKSEGTATTTTKGTGTTLSTNLAMQNTNSVMTDNLTTEIFSSTSTLGTSDTGSTTVATDPTIGTVTDSAFGTTNTTTNSTQQNQGTGTTESAGEANQIQIGKNTSYGYRVPSVESAAQNLRAQISLHDQQFAQFMFGQNLPDLAQVFTNELAMLDLDIKRLQVGYLDTILMSPFTGMVTGLFKNPGDRVKAGEPVVRVENNASVYLVGTLIYRGPTPITTAGVGSNVSVTTSVFDSLSTVTITGTVVAVRGHSAADDQWDVVVSCTNPLDAAGNPTFPSNYNFDFDDTTVTIT